MHNADNILLKFALCVCYTTILPNASLMTMQKLLYVNDSYF